LLISKRGGGLDSTELKELYAPKRLFFLTLSLILEISATRTNPTKAELLFLVLFFIVKEFPPSRAGWLGAFKALLVRFETKARNWLVLHYYMYLFTSLFFRKVNPKNKV
jgi:signal transduction histidine kinase